MGPGQNPEERFSHNEAQFTEIMLSRQQKNKGAIQPMTWFFTYAIYTINQMLKKYLNFGMNKIWALSPVKNQISLGIHLV